jgi:hypothetical protein
MTYREINQLEPGDYVISPSNEIFRFVRIARYVRSKPSQIAIAYTTKKSTVCVSRFELKEWYTLLEADDNRVKVLEVLYGPFENF